MNRMKIFLCSSLAWSLGSLHAAAANGFVIEWGWNTATGTPLAPRQVASNVIAISGGTFHSLALREDGTVFGWGDNYLGQSLGYKTPDSGTTNGIVRVNGQVLSNVVSIAAGREFSLALKKDGNIATWGENYLPKGLSNIVAVAAEPGNSWALQTDGTVVGWWREKSLGYGLRSVENLSNLSAIAVGPSLYGTRGVGLLHDGTVRHWGSETHYKDATPPAGLRNVVAIAAGASHSLALRSDGTVIGWGYNKDGEATGTATLESPNIAAGPVMIGGKIMSNIVSIAAGRTYSLGLKNNGLIVAWGRMVNGLYPVTVPEGLSNVVAIAAGTDSFCLAITTNAAVAARFRR